MMNEANDNDKKKGGKKRENCFSPKYLKVGDGRHLPTSAYVSLRLNKANTWNENDKNA